MNRYENTGDRNIDTVLSGINELDKQYSTNLYSRLAQIHELVSAVAFDKHDSDAVLNILRNVKPRQLGKFNVSALERIAVCREYLSLYPAAAGFRRELFFGSTEKPRETAVNKIGYIGNNYTDEAFFRFSSALSNAEAAVVRSFDELCESVYGGATEYGILPIENADNGKLPRFYSLIDKYELKIAAVCSIETSDNGSTKFALVRKNIEYPVSRFGKPDRLELFVTLSGDESFSDILTAASFCSMELYRIDSLPLSYHEGEFTLCPVFRVENADIDSFLLFMALDFPRYTPIGIFTYLK